MATETTFIQFAEGSAPSTPASTKWRAYFKTDGLYVIDDAGTETGPLADASGGSTGVAVATAQGTGSGDYTTSSSTFADVDGTNLIITPTNAQSGDILRISATFYAFSATAANTAVTFGIAGTDVGDTLGLGFAGSTTTLPFFLEYYYTMPSATQPAIKLRWKTASTSGTMYNRSAVTRPRMSVTNMNRGGTL